MGFRVQARQQTRGGHFGRPFSCITRFGTSCRFEVRAMRERLTRLAVLFAACWPQDRSPRGRSSGLPCGSTARWSCCRSASNAHCDAGGRDWTALDWRTRMSGLRVLIVEDDIIYAETVKILLERERHTVVGIAAHASEVRALTRAQHPDLALVDLHLNDG